MAPNSGPTFTHPPPLGLIISSPGGKFGWLARRYVPRLATSVYLTAIRFTRSGPTWQRIAHFVSTEAMPLFSHVEIETINKCNGDCAFCPVNRRVDTRPRLRMTDALYGRLLDQLAALRYAGYLSLYSNNEPLLDTRLPALARAARETVPDAFLSLSTNGSLLDVNTVHNLLPHFHRIRINNYGSRPELKPHLQAIYDHFSRPDQADALRGKTLEFCLRRADDVLTSRAGTAPNRPAPRRPLAVPCSLPFSQLIIRPDGKVSLCCNDALGQCTLGDASVQDLTAIWQDQPFQSVRAAMIHHGRDGHPLCRSCDFVKHDVN